MSLTMAGVSLFTQAKANPNFKTNNGWTHVGYYIGYGLVLEANEYKVGPAIGLSYLYNGRWASYGQLRGVGEE